MCIRDSLYVGGGTPSLLENEEVNQLIVEIRTHFNLLPDAEITLEANPDDLTEEKLKGWKAAGINRLSIGVQSFFEEDLRWMNPVSYTHLDLSKEVESSIIIKSYQA